MEALARALPPSLTALNLDGTCGAGGLFAVAVGLGMRCVAGRVWHAVPSFQAGGGGSRLRSPILAHGACLSVGLSRLALYNISVVRAAVALLLSLVKTPALVPKQQASSCGPLCCS